jgi:hypothetical protein
MGAELLFHRKNIESDGGIIEMKIWKVPRSTDKAFGLKYSLVYIQNGKRIIGYDNAEGKGDHKHYRNKEYQYRFSNIDNLVKDFCTDLEKAKRGEL